jgi:hypothetical protein
MTTEENQVGWREVAKTTTLTLLEDILASMRLAYSGTKDREEGAHKLIEVYLKYADFLGSVKGRVAEIEDLSSSILEALRVQEKMRAANERRSKTLSRGGCVVVKLVPCGKNCSGCPHGPYAYRVTKQGGKQHWEYLGKA